MWWRWAVNESRFGILIEGINKSRAAFDEAIASHRALHAAAGDAAVGQRKFTEAARDATTAAQNSGQALAAFAKFAIAGTVVTTAMVAAARGVADFQEQLDLASAATGLTTGQLAGLRVAASENGRSFDQIRPSLDFFVRKIGEAADGTETAITSFQRLGIGIRDANGQLRPTGDILREVQGKLNDFATPAERARAAMELFGRSGAASITTLLTPLDEAEAKARKLGIALGSPVTAFVRFGKQTGTG
jgi:hypothetical protein